MLTNTSGDKQAETHTVYGKQSSRDHGGLEKVEMLSQRCCQENTGAEERAPLRLWTESSPKQGEEKGPLPAGVLDLQ